MRRCIAMAVGASFSLLAFFNAVAWLAGAAALSYMPWFALGAFLCGFLTV